MADDEARDAMIWPHACPRCKGAVQYRANVPANTGGIAYDLDELVCLACGWRREKVGPISTHGAIPDEPKAPKHWGPVGTHGGGPPLGKWNRRYRGPA